MSSGINDVTRIYRRIGGINDATPAEWDAVRPTRHRDHNAIILKETTDWSHLDYTPQNHTYALNQYTGKLVAMWAEKTGEFKRFTKPLSFSKSKRTFDKITHSAAKPYREQVEAE